MKEKIYDVFWEGPFEWNDKKLDNRDFVLYALYGTHHLYGQNVLLYIGITDVGPKKRFIDHDYWAKYEYDKITVKVASVKEFESWEKWKIYERDIYPRFRNRNILKAIEALLIYAHQPAYNTVNKERIIKAKGIRVFNTGKCGLLLPEVSYYYHGE